MQFGQVKNMATRHGTQVGLHLTMSHTKSSRIPFSSSRLLFVHILCLHVLLLCCVPTVSGQDLCTGFPNCKCNTTSIVCTDQKLPNVSLILNSYTGDALKVDTIILFGNEFTSLPRNLFGDCSYGKDKKWHGLRYLDLSRNNVSEIHGQTFHCIPNLKVLKLEQNKWRVDRHSGRIGYFTNFKLLEELDLSDSFQDVWNGSIHLNKLATVFNNTDMMHLKSLNLAHNEFFTLSKSTGASLCNMPSLQSLNLSYNYLYDPHLIGNNTCLHNLEVLDLSRNAFESLSDNLISVLESMHSLKVVHIEDENALICDCRFLDTYNWLNSTHLVTDEAKKEVKCKTGYHSSYAGKPVLQLGPHDLLCDVPERPSNTGSVVIGIIFGVILCALVAFLVIHRRKVIEFCSKTKQRLPTVSGNSHVGYSTVDNV